MPLYKVVRPNSYYEFGAFVEEGADGMCQAVRATTEDGRLQIGGYYGLFLPIKTVKPYMLRIQRRGVDNEVSRQY